MTEALVAELPGSLRRAKDRLDLLPTVEFAPGELLALDDFGDDPGGLWMLLHVLAALFWDF